MNFSFIAKWGTSNTHRESEVYQVGEGEWGWERRYAMSAKGEMQQRQRRMPRRWPRSREARTANEVERNKERGLFSSLFQSNAHAIFQELVRKRSRQNPAAHFECTLGCHETYFSVRF